ncbi:hypothetical protein HX004_06470 [Myroides sp. 1354]|uniref:hypothetical protein n=1 Tax=unclassified Myroides TaxID=2642485 RepID=UPI00257842EE|nr:MULTISPECIES: hypothetical protein [unclassified Myroides]MDM1044706.1 hypothetical protein [Myroides sp. R163-1]MDM1055419.1 hypothetical protein [Myroides sp. 1354]MDM1068716.1 hypothetical protein [Myroides sp. 1372]
MKNLLLMVAFMLSIGVFAQNPKHPIDPNNEVCVQMNTFKPICDIISNGFPSFYGEYQLTACGPKSWLWSISPADLEEMVQDYICL